MATKLDAATNFLKEAKEVLGVIGVVGELVAFFVKLPGWCAIPLGILGALFILMWGWLERKNASKFIKAVARIGILAGVLTLAFFVGVGIILLTGEPPSAFGIVVDEVAREYSLSADGTGGGLAGKYPLEFTRKADLVEIGVMPASDDIGKVEKIDVTTRGPINQTNKMEELLNRNTDKQIYYRVTDPSPDFNITLETAGRLKAPNSTPGIRMRVHYKYGMREPLREARSWVFERFGQ